MITQYLPCSCGPLLVRSGDVLVETKPCSLLKPVVKDLNFQIAQAVAPLLIYAPVLIFIPNHKDDGIWFLWCVLYQLLAALVPWILGASLATETVAFIWGVPADRGPKDAIEPDAMGAQVVGQKMQDETTV